MKTELSKIAQDLEQGNITEKEARTLLLGLLCVRHRFKTRVETKSGTWFLTDEEIKQWEYDGSIEKGDKSYATILIKEY